MIRAIHPFGPNVGQYVPSGATDIRVTFARERARLRLNAPAGIEVRDISGEALNGRPASALPVTNAFLGMTGAVFA